MLPFVLLHLRPLLLLSYHFLPPLSEIFLCETQSTQGPSASFAKLVDQKKGNERLPPCGRPTNHSLVSNVVRSRAIHHSLACIFLARETCAAYALRLLLPFYSLFPFPLLPFYMWSFSFILIPSHFTLFFFTLESWKKAVSFHIFQFDPQLTHKIVDLK